MPVEGYHYANIAHYTLPPMRRRHCLKTILEIVQHGYNLWGVCLNDLYRMCTKLPLFQNYHDWQLGNLAVIASPDLQNYP